MSVDPEPHIRGAGEVGYFVDGNAQITVWEVEASRSRRLPHCSDIELRQVRSDREKRLFHTGRNAVARRHPKHVLIGEYDDGIVLAAVLLKVAGRGLEHLSEIGGIAGVIEFSESARTSGQRVQQSRETITKARRSETWSRLCEQDRTCNCGQRRNRRDHARTK